MTKTRLAIPVLGLVAALSACSTTTATQNQAGSGGNTGSGGTSAQGGSSAGGSIGSTGQGGSSAAAGSGGGTGGVWGTGGTSARGGAAGAVSQSGGSAVSGGARATGGAVGGSTGGASSGGAPGGSGGNVGSGGTGGPDAAQISDAAVNPGEDARSSVDASGTGGKSGSGGTTSTGGTTGTGGGTGLQTAGCGKTITHQDAKTQQTLQSGGASRYYLVYTPTNYDPNTPLPLVFALHGMNMNNWWAANDASGFKLIEATANKAIIVYPQGTGDAPGTTSKWGGINSSWSPGVTGADDKFIDALLALMQDNYCVDTSRIFVTGFSMGGWMTGNFACDHAKVFRAFAPVAGWGPGGMETGHGTKPSCSDTSVAVPILITQGSSDTTVTPDNGTNSRDFWIGRDGCTNTTSPVFTTSTGGATCVAYQGCKTGLAVDYCTHSGGHNVPGNAGAYIWAFFSSFN